MAAHIALVFFSFKCGESWKNVLTAVWV